MVIKKEEQNTQEENKENVGNDYYYAQTDGKLLCSTTKKIDNWTYTFDSSCKCTRGCN